MQADEDLIRMTAGGDHAAFQTLMQRHQTAVGRFLRAVVGTRQDTEDIVQETFLAAYRAAGQYRGDASFRTWLFRIARNAAYQARLRRIRQAECGGSLLTLALYAGCAADNPEQLAIERQRRASVARLLAALDAGDRQVIMLRDYCGMSGEDTARSLGIGLAAMKSRLHRARTRLAAGLHERTAVCVSSPAARHAQA